MKEPIVYYCSYTDLIDRDKLVSNPRNPNRHPESQIQMLAKIIEHQGWRSPIVVSKRSGFIVKGHGRLEAAKLLHTDLVPVDYQDYANEAAEWADMVADNKIAELAEIDQESLKELLQELDGQIDMGLTGFDDADLQSLFAEDFEGACDPDEQQSMPETVYSRLGDLWILGNHRLICGDATDEETVKRLLNGVSPHLMVTDPPYGVEYDPSWRKDALSTPSQRTGKVLNDDNADWSEAWHLFHGDVAYIWHAGSHSHTVANSLVSCKFKLRSQIIWAKPQLVISRGDYHWKHEPCWYAVRDKATGHWNGDRKQTTVWEITQKNQDAETSHGTQKPVECMKRPMENNSVPGDAVYEPFSGSGTTIIAAEICGRHCYAVELNPAYVDMAVARWEKFTGRKAIKQ